MIYNLSGHLFVFLASSRLLVFLSSCLLAFIFIRIPSKYTINYSLFTIHLKNLPSRLDFGYKITKKY